MMKDPRVSNSRMPFPSASEGLKGRMEPVMEPGESNSAGEDHPTEAMDLHKGVDPLAEPHSIREVFWGK